MAHFQKDGNHADRILSLGLYRKEDYLPRFCCLERDLTNK